MIWKQYILFIIRKRGGPRLTFCAANAEPDSKALIFF